MADDRQSLEERQRDLGHASRAVETDAESSSTRAGTPRLRVGCCALGPRPDHYFRRHSALELQQSFFEPPRAAALGRLREQAPPGFAFIVRAWQLITHEPGSPGYRRLASQPARPDACGLFRESELVREATARTWATARALGAVAISFETPASFSPSATHRERLARYFEDVDREGLHLIWDPRGVWSQEAARAVCGDLGLTLCLDPTAPDFVPPPEDEVGYFKLQGMGRRGPVSEDELIPILEHASTAPETFCLFNTIDSLRDAQRFQALFADDEDDDDQDNAR
jgi:uncharacterized protein YecE (DUF72 family)